MSSICVMWGKCRARP